MSGTDLRARAFVDGAYADAADGATFDSVNPATGDVLAQVASCGPEDVDRAVRGARAAFEAGRDKSLHALDKYTDYKAVWIHLR